VLLGDKDQLASVEAGAVLGDLYVASQSIAPLGECVALLEHSYRYDADRGIGALARAIQTADADAAMAAFGTSEVRLCPPDEKLLRKGALWQEILAGFRPCLEANDPHQRLSALANFRVLSAHRRGPSGVEQLNPLIVERLAESGLIEPRGAQFDGRPILITENDARQGLFNGDVGIICREDGRLWAYFPSAEGADVRRFACPLLPAHETAFAMTVHKSQGSEFRSVAVVMPSRISPVVTRELIYTAISRARERVVVFADEVIVRAAIARQVRRHSGLESRFRVGLLAER
jgi:exodeoxyribonuclease V alpha subunit